MFSILFTPPAPLVNGGVERETFILGENQFPLLVPPYQGYGVHISLSRPLNPRQVTAVAPLGETPAYPPLPPLLGETPAYPPLAPQFWGTLKSGSPQSWGARGAKCSICELKVRCVYTVAYQGG